MAILRKAEMGLGSPAARKCEACVSEARLESASAGLRCVLGPRNESGRDIARKRRKGLEGERGPCVASIDAAGGGLGDAVDWFQSALTGASRPGYTNPMAARCWARSPRLGSLAGWGPRRLWTPSSARSAACTPCAFCGQSPEGVEGPRQPRGEKVRGLCQRSPAGIRLRRASLRLGAEELIRAAEEGCAL